MLLIKFFQFLFYIFRQFRFLYFPYSPFQAHQPVDAGGAVYALDLQLGLSASQPGKLFLCINAHLI